MRPGVQHRLQTTTRVDWFGVLTDLNRRGLTTVTIAQLVTAPRATVLGWKQGAEPNHADGERLVGLWVRITGNARESVPMTACPAWLDR